MANPISRCIRAAGYSGKYSSHPGNIPLILLIMTGAIFGLEKVGRRPSWVQSP